MNTNRALPGPFPGGTSFIPNGPTGRQAGRQALLSLVLQLGKLRLCAVSQPVTRAGITTRVCVLFLSSMPAPALPAPT